jgi:hypothetical protein
LLLVYHSLLQGGGVDIRTGATVNINDVNINDVNIYQNVAQQVSFVSF